LQENEIQEIANNYDLTVSIFEAMEGGAGNSSSKKRAAITWDLT